MSENEKKIIDEANYQQPAPQPKAYSPMKMGKGGDPLFRRINATKEQLIELLDETTTVQDWIQKETCNNVALACLNNENLKEAYYKIKDGFGEYGPIILMGYKTPQGVEIPRLKILNKDGSVKEVLSGPFVIEELTRRVAAFEESSLGYEVIDDVEEITGMIEDYTGNFSENTQSSL